MQVAGVVAVKYIKELVRVSKDLFLIEGCRLRMGDISQELHMAWDKMTHSAELYDTVLFVPTVMTFLARACAYQSSGLTLCL